MLFIISQFRYLLIILFSVFDEIGMWNDWYWDWISRTWIVQNRHQCSCYWHHHHRWFCGRQVAMSMIYENKQTKKLVTIISIRSNEWQWLILRQRQTKNENNGVWRNRVFHISNLKLYRKSWIDIMIIWTSIELYQLFSHILSH